MAWSKADVRRGVQGAVAELSKKRRVRDKDSLVLDLGFDSLKIASLVMSLEERFGTPILLNDWIGQVSDPTQLTVGSLGEYVFEALREAGLSSNKRTPGMASSTE